MYKILIADDEEKIRQLIRKYGEFDGHKIIEAENGIEAIEKVSAESPDIVVLDIMMPEIDGFTATKEIRKKSDIPIIMLSARGEEYDKIHGFELGIDDYVVKPFSPRELMMRISAVMARVSKPQKNEHEIFEYEGLLMDFTARRVFVDGNELYLSPKEYDLLFYMAHNRGVALSREKMISDVWGYDFFGGDRTLDTHVKLLRKALGEYSSRIVTLRGVGYRFEA
ncbi:MAG: response regulator transcription factor [Clostridia bacterium]|nr:response regulator transcription factor [Clostridia bacterium]